MSGMEGFWYLLGAMSGVAASLVLLPLMRDLPRRAVWIGAVAGAASLLAFGIYRIVGAPEWAGRVAGASVASAPHAQAAPAAAGSLAEAAARLAARLARGEGGEADWQLLAQSYDALGDTKAAAEARAHRLAATSSPGTTTGTGTGTGAAAGDDAPVEHATASGWADHADRLASAARSLQGAPAVAIERALALDPRHPKALWLAASYAMEVKDYPRAQAQWQRLLAVLPADSPDRRIIDANLAETRALMEEPATPALRGTVDIDPALKTAVPPGATLFVFARTNRGGGPPLAAVKLHPVAWPAHFALDDSNAMLPGSSLAAAGKLYVEARLSVAGNAAAAPGDLLAEGAWVSSRDGQVALRLTGRRP